MSNLITEQEQRENIAAALAEQALQTAELVLQTAALEAAAGIGSAESASYLFQVVDFGGANTVEVIEGPAGKTGRVVSFTVYNITEIFHGDTTQARLDVGDGADANGYAFSTDVPAEQATATSVSPVVSAGVLGNSLPGATPITLTFVSTVGTPTGISDALVVINWS
jgi:hypothetical protein